jgi:hypothetical protein
MSRTRAVRLPAVMDRLRVPVALAGAWIVMGMAAPAVGQFSVAIGPDITLGDIQDIVNHGVVGDVAAYSLGSRTCNIGDAPLLWLNYGTPGFGMNAYRLHDGRLMQIGQSFVKHACCVSNASAPAICAGMSCQAGPSGHLRVGCLDTYSASWNAGQSRLGPRSGINAYTGQFSSFSTATGNAVFKRLQVRTADLSSAAYPGALFFVEGVYVCTEDAQWGNWFNNATYRRTTVTGTSMGLTGNSFATVPAIHAWRDHGNGPSNPDPSVQIVPLDVPAEGRFFVGARVKDNGDGTWRYDYAVYNLSSDRSGASFSVPAPAGVNINSVGFHSPFYHSGEPATMNTAWTHSVDNGAITWSYVPEGPASNAIRWGTMYNFWFTADRPPAAKDGEVTLGLFKPAAGMPDSVSVAAQVPASGACEGDLNDDGAVDVFDLLELLGAWGKCDGCAADLDGNGAVDVFDLLILLGAWGPCP